MTEHTIPVLPVTHPAGSGAVFVGNNRGLEGKDATFIHQTSTADAFRDVLRGQAESVKDILIRQLEHKADAGIQAERLERENQNKMDAVRVELLNAVKSEGIATRDMLVSNRSSDQAAKIANLEAQLLKLVVK